MKHEKFEVNISPWDTESFGKMIECLEDKITPLCCEIIRNAFLSEDTYAYFPREFDHDDGIGGDSPRDPLTIYVRVAIGEEGKEPPTYSFSIRDILKPGIRDCLEYGSHASGLKKISSELKALAAEIDKATSHGK